MDHRSKLEELVNIAPEKVLKETLRYLSRKMRFLEETKTLEHSQNLEHSKTPTSEHSQDLEHSKTPTSENFQILWNKMIQNCKSTMSIPESSALLEIEKSLEDFVLNKDPVIALDLGAKYREFSSHLARIFLPITLLTETEDEIRLVLCSQKSLFDTNKTLRSQLADHTVLTRLEAIVQNTEVNSKFDTHKITIIDTSYAQETGTGTNLQARNNQTNTNSRKKHNEKLGITREYVARKSKPTKPTIRAIFFGSLNSEVDKFWSKLLDVESRIEIVLANPEMKKATRDAEKSVGGKSEKGLEIQKGRDPPLLEFGVEDEWF